MEKNAEVDGTLVPFVSKISLIKEVQAGNLVSRFSSSLLSFFGKVFDFLFAFLAPLGCNHFIINLLVVLDIKSRLRTIAFREDAAVHLRSVKVMIVGFVNLFLRSSELVAELSFGGMDPVIGACA